MTILETGNSDQTHYPLGINLSSDMSIINLLINKFKTISHYYGKNINLYCAGSSGAIMATIFSMNVPNCRIIHIKKENEQAHSSNMWLAPFKENHINVIIDDFIASGATVNRIASYVTEGIDCLVISGYSNFSKCNFKPHFLVCGINKS